MKPVVVIVAVGLVVLTGGVLVARDLMKPAEVQRAESAWSPARQITLERPDGSSKSMHLQPDPAAETSAAIGRMIAFDKRWHDAVTLAENTPRFQLAGPVKDLQALARESLSIALSQCFEPGRESWSAALELHVQSFIAYMANDARRQVTALEDSTRELRNWRKVVDACS